jgi:outer membrane protein assembly factor BamB
MKRGVATLLFFVVPLVVCAQANDAVTASSKVRGERAAAASSPSSLSIVETTESQFSGPIFGRVKCDEDGNVYLRSFTQERVTSDTVHQSPIQKIKADGSLAESFKVDDLASKFSARDFFVTKEGDLYQIAYTEKHEFYVLEFSSDGSLKTKTRLETEACFPYQLAVFKSGELLLSGTLWNENSTRFTGVFSAAGKLIKRLATESDQHSAKNADAADSALNSPGGGRNPAVYGEAVAASDGNVYLMQAGSRARVYAVSSTGEIIRSFYVDSGDSGLVGVSMKSAPGRLVIAFRRTDSAGILLKVVDLEGNAIADYASSERGLPAAFLACYVPPGFIFAQSNAHGPLHLNKAAPR